MRWREEVGEKQLPGKGGGALLKISIYFFKDSRPSLNSPPMTINFIFSPAIHLTHPLKTCSAHFFTAFLHFTTIQWKCKMDLQHPSCFGHHRFPLNFLFYRSILFSWCWWRGSLFQWGDPHSLWDTVRNPWDTSQTSPRCRDVIVPWSSLWNAPFSLDLVK